MPPGRMDMATLPEASGVKFGTSGARGRVADMTDLVCYAYTVAFIQHLESTGDLGCGPTPVAVAGDLRPSTGRIMHAVSKAVVDCGHTVQNCGRIPTPALAWHGIREGIPSVMVTGSHIPDDRNGIKYNKPAGEILKDDEAGILSQTVPVPGKLFEPDGAFAEPVAEYLPAAEPAAYDAYCRRYLDFFAPDCLSGLHLCLYEHSSVARETIGVVLTALGARVTPLGRSERFVPVDTEAIREEDILLARQWGEARHFDAIVSADGDGDRPLISDETGRWLRGDVAGILCAGYLDADVVVTPVSSNTAVELCGRFRRVCRTRIGSPYVIAGMQQALAEGAERVVGYEANGGFLTASDITVDGRTLPALPTRDTLIVLVSILGLSRQQNVPVSRLVADLPQRFTASGRLKEFPTALSRAKLSELLRGDFTEAAQRIEAVFGTHFGQVAALDNTDGLRITFHSGEVAHLRGSGNAPEFRCYNEADSEHRAAEMNRICLSLMDGWRRED